jgi:hypothetical protein
MAITYVGGVTAKVADGGNPSADLTSISGLAQDDVVLGCVGVPRNTQGGTSSSGYTQLAQIDQSTVCRNTVFRKVMGATPDTAFVGVGSANAADAVIVHVRAYRGVDTSTPEDATSTTVGANSTNPDPASITTVTNGARVVVFAVSNVLDAATTIPSGYGNAGADNQADTRPMTIGGADIDKATAGAEDPPSWTNWNTANWACITVALRPAGAAAGQPTVRRWGWVPGMGQRFTPTRGGMFMLSKRLYIPSHAIIRKAA